MSSDGEEAAAPRLRLSCYKHFDMLWFCYTPAHQLQQYYRLGTLDNCSQKWSALYDCLNLKTKRTSAIEDILETREKSEHHIWTFRSPHEAKSHWRKLFGHLEGQE
ncbi:hypothetical protein BUALT_Bualt02G0033300 [Buddleja alternifolia]|uniref:Uncharacterized protein n=1 Tax=Buddleja alternifolia TaxID=168488 RepID=A0AAV6XZ77_9LAMI|nr:hypothetical protein BUALT_Bualt02G0033300 [Buddleja alternifolia]